MFFQVRNYNGTHNPYGDVLSYHSTEEQAVEAARRRVSNPQQTDNIVYDPPYAFVITESETPLGEPLVPAAA